MRLRRSIPMYPAVLALACSTMPPKDMPAPPAAPIDACERGSVREEVTIEYLGAGGFAIRLGDQALLTAPFYSNPSFLRVGLGLPIAPNLERIPDRPPLLESANVVGVLVGHAHYDHLMDVPAVLQKWGLASVPVYGDETALHLLANDEWTGPAFPVNDSGGTWRRRGTWLHPPAPAGQQPPLSRFRVMPLLSEHAPHMAFGIKLFQGHVEPGVDRPRDAYDWKEGQTWGFLIDVLADDGATPLLRIHYQDSASNPELGWPPRELLVERRVDLALFCAASFALVREHPQAILRELEPRHALAAHWEDFSRDPEAPPRVVPLTDMRELLARLRSTLTAGRFSVPMRGAQLRFAVCPAS